jgi:transposase
MLSLSSSHRFLLYSAPCDMRKSFDSLSGLVTNELGRNPCSGEVFVFINRGRNFIKLLHWEKDGFVLYFKRLEQGTFTPPQSDSLPQLPSKGRPLRWPELVLMLEGIKAEKLIQKPRFSLENKREVQ